MDAVPIKPALATPDTTRDHLEPFASALNTHTRAIDARLHAQALRRVSAALRAQRQSDPACPTGLSSLVLNSRSETLGHDSR